MFHDVMTDEEKAEEACPTCGGEVAAEDKGWRCVAAIGMFIGCGWKCGYDDEMTGKEAGPRVRKKEKKESVP